LQPPHPVIGAANSAAHLWRRPHEAPAPWLRSSSGHRMEHRHIDFTASPPLLCSTDGIRMQLCRRSLAAPVRRRIPCSHGRTGGEGRGAVGEKHKSAQWG
jgi:hypothetical protein